MKKQVRKINKSQLVEMVTNITKKVLQESIFSDPEVRADEYEEQQDHFRNNPGMPMDEPEGIEIANNNPMGGDEDFYDDFLSNPAEESFPTEEPGVMPGDEVQNQIMPEDELRAMLESKEKEELQEKQDKLLNFITENWDHHANNLIK